MAAADSTLDYTVQFWTSRGFAVADVNYGGSTGFGRAYRQRLNGQWGVVDVADSIKAAEFLVGEGKADPARLVIRGGSAGGFTTLAALTATRTCSRPARAITASAISKPSCTTRTSSRRGVSTSSSVPTRR